MDGEGSIGMSTSIFGKVKSCAGLTVRQFFVKRGLCVLPILSL